MNIDVDILLWINGHYAPWLDEVMWTELMMDNADYLTPQIDLLIEHLQAYQKALHDRDREQLCALLKEGREMKEKAGGR